MKMTSVFMVVVLAFCASCVTSNARDKGKKAKMKKICFVAGKDSHGKGKHSHGPGLQYMADELKKHVPNVEVAVHKGGWPEDASFFDGADAVVIYCDGGRRHVVMNHLKEIDKMVKSGMGIGCIHYGVEVPKGEPGDYMLSWTGGYFETDWSVNPHWTAEFKSIPDHEVNRGVKPFTMNDEWYFHMRFPENMKNVTPVLSAVPPMSTIERKDGPHSNNPTVRKEVKERLPQHLAWVIERPDGGRGFGTTGGHYHAGWKMDSYRKLVLNSILWIAKVDVPEDGVPSPTPTDEALEAYLQ